MPVTLAHHIVGGFEGTSIPKTLKNLIQKDELGGVILFRRNIESIPQVKKLIRELYKLAGGRPFFIGVDQEGGRVFRLGEPFTIIPPMGLVGEYYQKTKDLKTVREVGRILGRELRAVGFNWDFAPVVDVHSNPKNPIIGDRSFSPNPALVSTCAAALIRGLHDEGVLSCAKHFPGHGATALDSHLDLPIVRSPGRLLWKRDLVPYRKLISQGLIRTLMTAHVRYPAFDTQNCATLSSAILQNLLREKLKYKGLIVSDDLFMKAISDRMDLSEATVQFFEAGGDVVLICKDPEIQKDCLEALKLVYSQEKTLRTHFQKSHRRLEKQKAFLSQKNSPPASVIGAPEHRALVNKLLSWKAASQEKSFE